ncbi:hypothetical protein [Kitasatospora aureofaciens]|uniref:hypothetical protein n=1 Tax=Kitasatospora aureofaciens TaxID=1894 RepID=UPI0033D6CEC7
MPARTRTKRRSFLPPLKLSTLLPSHYNLRPDEVNTVVCPDCQTWQRIMGDKTLTIRDHYSTDLSGAELEAGQRDTRCSSARRIVEVDVKVAHWAKQVEEGSTQVAARRATTVLKKIPTPKPAALHQLDPAPATADSARKTYETHCSRCTTCTGKSHCQDGQRLHRHYLHLLRLEPQHRRERELAAAANRKAERKAAKEAPARRARQWDDVRLRVLAKDILREIPLQDALGPIRGAAVPTDHEDTKKQSQALAKTRTEKAIREASPVRAAA